LQQFPISIILLRIAKNLLKLAELSAIWLIFTSYSAAMELILMARIRRRGLVAFLRNTARPCNQGGGVKKANDSAVCRDRVSFFSRRQAPRIYNSACHKLKLGIADLFDFGRLFSAKPKKPGFPGLRYRSGPGADTVAAARPSNPWR
jgi:hypothetical protein